SADRHTCTARGTAAARTTRERSRGRSRSGTAGTRWPPHGGLSGPSSRVYPWAMSRDSPAGAAIHRVTVVRTARFQCMVLPMTLAALAGAPGVQPLPGDSVTGPSGFPRGQKMTIAVRDRARLELRLGFDGRCDGG